MQDFELVPKPHKHFCEAVYTLGEPLALDYVRCCQQLCFLSTVALDPALYSMVSSYDSYFVKDHDFAYDIGTALEDKSTRCAVGLSAAASNDLRGELNETRSDIDTSNKIARIVTRTLADLSENILDCKLSLVLASVRLEWIRLTITIVTTELFRESSTTSAEAGNGEQNESELAIPPPLANPSGEQSLKVQTIRDLIGSNTARVTDLFKSLPALRSYAESRADAATP